MFSGLTATVRFRRRSLYYIFQMYIPCICVVIVSWIAFWIDHKEGSERVGLGISAVLTISYMRGSMNAGMPRVSYLKSIDYFLLISFVFVFMSLIEYVLVIKEFRKGKRKGKDDIPESFHTAQVRRTVEMWFKFSQFINVFNCMIYFGYQAHRQGKLANYIIKFANKNKIGCKLNIQTNRLWNSQNHDNELTKTILNVHV